MAIAPEPGAVEGAHMVVSFFNIRFLQRYKK
jgi:hypothetical protein